MLFYHGPDPMLVLEINSVVGSVANYLCPVRGYLGKFLYYKTLTGWPWENLLLKKNYRHIQVTVILLEKAMAPHSSTLACKIPWTEEPGRLQPMGSLRVGHNWATSLSLFTFIHWRRKWQPTPAFLPWESQGWQSLVGCRLWDRTESDTTEAT